jgi:hypothetical protein
MNANDNQSKTLREQRGYNFGLFMLALVIVGTILVVSLDNVKPVVIAGVIGVSAVVGAIWVFMAPKE